MHSLHCTRVARGDVHTLCEGLKPRNVLIGEKGYGAKIADYGIARVVDMNSTMTSKGTLLYQAPEVARSMCGGSVLINSSSLCRLIPKHRDR